MERFEYDGYYGIPSFCHIEQYKLEDNVVVVATEPEGYSGTSITNRAEYIATKVCDTHNIPFPKLIWIEHYNRIFGKETWDLVIFKIEKGSLEKYPKELNDKLVFVSPTWGHLTPEQKDRIIQGDLTALEELTMLKPFEHHLRG